MTAEASVNTSLRAPLDLLGLRTPNEPDAICMKGPVDMPNPDKITETDSG